MTKPWAGSGLMHAALAARFPGAKFACNLDTGEITAWRTGGQAEEPPDDDAIRSAIDAFLAGHTWPPARPAFVTYAALRERMTPAEREAIFILRRTNWQIDDFVTAAAEGIDLAGAGVAEAKAALVAAGIFQPAAGQTMQQRADEIFSA